MYTELSVTLVWIVIFLEVPFNTSNSTLGWEVVSCLSDEEAEAQSGDVSDTSIQSMWSLL